MILVWSVVVFFLVVLNPIFSAVPNRRSSNVATQDAIAEDQPRCYTKKCAGSQGASIKIRRDKSESYPRRPFRQTAPVKCGGTGLPPPCGRKATRDPGSTVPNSAGSRPRGPPKTHQTAPVTCGDTGLPPPCHWYPIGFLWKTRYNLLQKTELIPTIAQRPIFTFEVKWSQLRRLSFSCTSSLMKW